MAPLPAFPYGAVYFRKSNPPPEDWERDYRTAAEDGLNAFRHWFLWSAIEVAPGEYDWADYDRQLDLAAGHGIATVIAEFLSAAPEWAWCDYPHARYQDASGAPAVRSMGGSSATGGFPGLCLDNPDVLALGERFLTTLAQRYCGHPGLGGYDVWNECNIAARYCYCPATTDRFREWLEAKYGTPREVSKAWFRHSITEWRHVDPPRQLGPYPDSLDWLQFRADNAYRLMRWRVETIRRHDPDHPVTAHGVAQTLTDHAAGANDEWRAAAEVDSYGFTWVQSRRGDEPWKHFHAVDLTRAGSRGKPFWHAEAQAGPLWLQPQVVGRPRDDGRISSPEDVRYWSLTSFAGGATGWLCPRWRPLLDGPLFGAFGPYALDGGRTDRSEIVGRLARWATAPEQAALWRARPVRGDVGIIFVPESNVFSYLQQGRTEWYAECARGAYQGFFDLNAQPDWVHVDDLITAAGPAPYRLLYLPYPVHLRTESAAALRAWVEQGGTLVSEGCPAFFGDRGRAGTTQPNLGLDALFGARERYVEFTPDISDDLTFSMEGQEGPVVPGALFLQAYDSAGGAVAGRYAEGYATVGGQPAVIDHTFGKGRTRLVGTFPGAARSRADDPVARRGAPSGSTFTTHRLAQASGPPSEERRAALNAFFAGLLAWAGITPHVRTDNPQVIARLHHDPGTGEHVLWALNPTDATQRATLTLAGEAGRHTKAQPAWPEGTVVERPQDGRLTVDIGGRDAVVLKLGSRAT